MKLIINIFIYFCIALAIMQNHFALAFLAISLFTFRCGAIWLLPLAFAIDGYFGAFYQVPMISIMACLWYGVSEFIRPQLILQYEKAS